VVSLVFSGRLSHLEFILGPNRNELNDTIAHNGYSLATFLPSFATRILAHFMCFLSYVSSSVATQPPHSWPISKKTFCDHRCSGIPTALIHVFFVTRSWHTTPIGDHLSRLNLISFQDHCPCSTCSAMYLFGNSNRNLFANSNRNMSPYISYMFTPKVFLKLEMTISLYQPVWVSLYRPPLDCQQDIFSRL